MTTQPETNAKPNSPVTQTAAKTPANALRENLRTLEKRISRLSELTTPQALEILTMLDQAAATIQQLETAGMNLSSELSQFETIQGQLTRQGRRFLARIGGAKTLVAARQQRDTNQENWWWRLDLQLAEARRAATKRALVLTVIVVLVLAGITLIYQRFLAPDPAVAARYGYLQGAENSLTTGDYKSAYIELQAALAYTPDDPELLILEGLLLEYLDDPEGAAESYQAAEEQSVSQACYHEMRAGYFLMASQFERVISEAELAIELNEDSVLGYMHAAQAYEALADYYTAIDYYELADEVAQRIGNAQLQVIIRVNLSNVLQRSMQTMPTPYPAP